ncbi:MAG: branched-chain amino acid ABC transporter ATP-binding protein/permease [Piscinibacter sp.]|uniref:branched-chain amino acid ABC transporter ATP-binding protein/permease n=1 Tax=Piscinibacter sp. TaxID=1903157 RepID=UPI001B4BC7BB|nr:branched-chain amino acid ABC transporter ATP-binding protein/permease [Piscinibacter sp.]MBP5989496.1 branched-chain amino acid ABC transporter ATP-binding protein/permease [Piscinibacter sp.]MBP6027243.1 branched-chain amino acid ABC transporter ATP-binding protein/permease [Piscinibacter sp.]
MKARRYVLVAFVLLAAALPLLPVPEFWITQANYIGLYSLVAIGLVLLTGVAGLTSFGQAAFVGMGAYTAAYLTLTHGVSPWLTVWVGLAFTYIAALVLGWITLRMSGHYLPLATIAWGLSLYYLLGNIDALGKYDGLLGIPALEFFGLTLNTGRSFYVLLWLIVLLAAFGAIRLLDSRTGRALRAVKGGTTMAEAMGVDTFRLKVTAFVLAALLASVSGWLFAHFQRTVNPSPFGLNKGIEYLFMAVIGGVGHVWGAIVGSTVVKVLEEQLQDWLPRLMGTSGNYEIIVFGILLIVVLQYARDGIWAFVEARFPKPPRAVDWADAEPLPHREQPPRGEVVLDVQGVSKQFGGLVAVNDVGFQVRAGQILGLIGPNGAGKSTTFNLITGVLAVTRGKVMLRGQEVQSLPSRQIAARGVARTFQHVKMIPSMTVLENVALGAHLRGKAGVASAVLRLDRSEEQRLMREAQQQLQRIGMGERMHELAGNLALGPQRLMEIARALCADPMLLLLDEPAAGLRLKEKQALAAVLRQLRDEGMAILLVEHDMDLVMGLVDRVVVMEFGTKLIEGTPEEVQASPAVRAAYLGTEH